MAEKITPSEIYQTLSRLREKYTDDDDINRINDDYQSIRALLARQSFAESEQTQEIINLCRKDILTAKTKLATDRSLIGDEKAQRELWFVIESREWFLKLVVKDYESELQSLYTELQEQLQK